ncbi:uncharacterized protein LOC132256511 [Phlebotomus argentipes]|uniref:uncharacterized protein LOC132256511 n=1 Tax=Phlebotomus argentipes TaxID=94469 RepID=UPI002892D076|nr:uncharacterized protein LOC132256511 [Phlebotomus argentipes]XP_059608952.1 uncharacterized protein LOC132256511 [Phlebotomus argentipes]
MVGRLLLVSLCVILWSAVQGQENAQTRISAALQECYRDQELFMRDNRLPHTPEMLIELIRKVEDSENWNQDMRQLSLSIVHRFRQDGIERAPGVDVSEAVLPFSPMGFQFTKHRILLTRLLPGNAQQFPNDTLTATERCALHFMLSTSVDTAVRGDENIRCNQLSQYRSRVPRDVEGEEEPEDQVEADEEPEPVEDEELEEKNFLDTDFGEQVEVTNVNTAISQCPVENGVILSQWGALSAGPVISGIAAGLSPQSVTTRELLALSREASRSQQQQQNFNVDNRWAATLSGDLSEVALRQGSAAGRTIAVGAPGTFNSTLIPRWFFLRQREFFEMTDPEIRGGLDGLIMGLNVVDWRNRYNPLKLSQVLDMYYSQRGVFERRFRACNRNSLFPEVAPVEQLRAQTTAFSTVLDRDMQLRVTLNPAGIQTFSNAAVESLSTYIPQSLNDPSCAVTNNRPNDENIWRTSADLYIFLDTSWPFMEISGPVAHLLHSLDVNPFGTSYTLMNAVDGSVIVGKTNSLSDLYHQWNLTTHQTHPQGVEFPHLLPTLQVLMTNQLDQERQNGTMGGRSKIVLIIPNMSGVSGADSDFADERLRSMREIFPDMELYFLSGGTATRWNRFVRNPRIHIHPLRVSGLSGAEDNTIPAQLRDLITRIQENPRRIINHRCGATWQSEDQGIDSQNDYVEPEGIVFYRVSPNYFFRAGDRRRVVRIQGQGYSTLTVCMSRTEPNPRANATNQNGEVRCTRIAQNSFEEDVSDYCTDHFYIHHCPPLFISVEGPSLSGGDQIQIRCNDRQCRFPDNSRFALQTENLGCFSGSGVKMTFLFMILSPLLLLLSRLL